MDIHVMNEGEEYVDVHGEWQKHWVFQLVSFMCSANELRFKDSGVFTLKQALGDEVWQFLVSQREEESALKCFEYMVQNQMFDFHVEQISKGVQTYELVQFS